MSTESRSYAEILALHAAYERGELQSTALEAKARTLCGWDQGEVEPLTAEEREYMADDAYNCSPSYPYAEGILLNDAELSRWWLRAMSDYVSDLF